MVQSSAEARRRRLLRRGARSFVAAGLVLGLLGLALMPGTPVPTFVGRANGAGGGGGGNGGSTHLNLTLNMTDRPAFDPGFLSVPAGSNVNLTLVNRGAYNHSFTMLNRHDVQLNRSWTPTQINTYLRTNGSQANVSVAAGAQTNVSLTFLSEQAGFSFEFFSAIPYQFQAGMVGFLNVTGPPTGPGIVANVTAAASATAWLETIVAINTSQFPVTVDMQVINSGSNLHTFWLSSQPNYTLNFGNFTAYFVQHPPAASVQLSQNPGSAVWANFTLSKAGVYEFICNVPGHFSNGMYGFLYVGVPPPAPAVQPSSEIVSEWILLGGATLLGAGALLAAGALFVGRFPRAPPGAGGH